MIGFVGIIAQGLERFPDRHVEQNGGIPFVVDDVRGVAGRRLQAPNEARSSVSQSVDGIELGDEFGNLGIVDGGDETPDVNLSQVVVHDGLRDASPLPTVTSRIIKQQSPSLSHNRVRAQIQILPAQHNAANPYWFFRQRKFRPAVGMPLVIALGAHVRICGTQVQEPKSIVNVNLSETPIARYAKVQTCFLAMKTYPAKLAVGNRIVLVEDMVFAFLKGGSAIQFLERIRAKPDNQLELMIAG